MLISRNYPPDLIKAGIERAEKIDIEDLRKLKSKSSENETLPFVCTHNPPNGNFSPSIKETMDLLSNDSETAHIFRTPKLVPYLHRCPLTLLAQYLDEHDRGKLFLFQKYAQDALVRRKQHPPQL